jgi:transposase InsO family protein
MALPQGPKQRWSLDFVSDMLADGRRFRVLVVVDDVESLDGRFRDECLNENLFRGMAAARSIIEEWRIDYNEHRPHTSLHIRGNVRACVDSECVAPSGDDRDYSRATDATSRPPG